MLLTGTSATPTLIELIDAGNGTVSGTLIGGAIFAFIVVIGILLASALIAYKWRGNAGGALMAFIMGFVGAVIVPSAAGIISTLVKLDVLMGSKQLMNSLAGFLLYALIIAGADLGARYYILFYMDKTGLGMHKGLSIAGGYAFGSVFRYVTVLLSHVVSLFEINKGTFLPEELKENPSVYNSRAAFQNQALVSPDSTYFNLGMELLAVAVLYVLLTMYMIRGWLEENKKRSALVAGAGMFVFEAARRIFSALLASEVINEAQELLYLTIFYVIALAVMGWLLYKVLKDYPKGREKFMKSMRQRAAESETRQRRSTWNQINEYNARVDSEENADPDAEDSEREILSFTEEPAAADETEVSEDSGEEGPSDDGSGEGSV